MQDTLCLISIPASHWKSYPSLRPFCQLVADALTMERRIGKRMNALVESERLQDQAELIQVHARALLNSPEGRSCSCRSFGLPETTGYLRLLRELASSPQAVGPRRMKEIQRTESQEYYEDVELPPDPPSLLGRALGWLNITKRPPEPRVERRWHSRTVVVPATVEIITTTGHHFPWQMSFFPWEYRENKEVEHYHDLLLRIRIDDHLPRLGLNPDEVKRLRTTVSEVAAFFGKAADAEHSVVICLAR